MNTIVDWWLFKWLPEIQTHRCAGRFHWLRQRDTPGRPEKNKKNVRDVWCSSYLVERLEWNMLCIRIHNMCILTCNFTYTLHIQIYIVYNIYITIERLLIMMSSLCIYYIHAHYIKAKGPLKQPVQWYGHFPTQDDQPMADLWFKFTYSDIINKNYRGIILKCWHKHI